MNNSISSFKFNTRPKNRWCSKFNIRDRPFNLNGEGGRGGYDLLFRSEFFFRTTQELEYLFFCRAKRNFFSQNSTLGYMTKTLNQIFFSLHQNQNIFFSNIENQNIFLEKNHNPLGTFHLRGLALQLSGKNPSFALQNTFHLRWFFTLDLPVTILQLRRLPVIF